MNLSPKKILIIQLRQLGDVLLTAPAARVLRKNFPEARIDFLTEPPADQLLKGNPALNNILLYDRKSPVAGIFRVRAEKYDLIVDFMSNPRSALLTAASGAALKAGPGYTGSSWAYNRKFFSGDKTNPYVPFQKIDFLSALGLQKISYSYPEIYPDASDEQWALEAVESLGLPRARTLSFAPASRRATRQWPPEHYARLAAMSADKLGVNVLIFWGPGELDLAEKIAGLAASTAVRVAPKTGTLLQLAALLKSTLLLVSNCSGTKHIAQAAGVSTLGIYGSSRPENWTPPGDPAHQFIRDNSLDCIGCRLNRCPIALKCLRDLSPETVFAKLVTMPAVKELGEASK